MDLVQQILLNYRQNLVPFQSFYTLEDHVKLLQQSNFLLMKKNLDLEKQLEQIKQWKRSSQNMQTQDSKGRNEEAETEKRVKRKYNPRRSNLDKKFICKINQCHRKYSSRIALNSHLRRKHKIQPE